MQDDWRVSSDLKVLYGVRYDLYDVPDGVANAPIATSHEFPQSKNNFAPRVGAVWSLGESKTTVLRANTGLMYDQTLNAIYETGAAERRHQRAGVGHVHADPGRGAGVPRRAQRGLGRHAEPRVDG